MIDLLAPIDTSQAWHGAELEALDAWRRRLTKTEIAALTHTADAARDAPCPGFGGWAFEIPELEPLTAWMARQLEQGIMRWCLAWASSSVSSRMG